MVNVFIFFNFGEARPSEITLDPSVLSTRCLLQSIQHSLESAHMQLSVEGLKPFQMINEHLLLNHSIEECCLHIHLTYFPSHLH